MGFSEQLKKARLNLGLTQQQVADIMGITKSTYCGYETGKRQPDVAKVKRLARILNTSGDVLLETGFEQNETNSKKEINTSSVSTISSDDQIALNLYRQLDINDKGEIKGEMKGMLKAPKYKKNTSIAIEEKPEVPDIDLTKEEKENITPPPSQEDSPSSYPLTYFDDFPVSAGTGFYSMDIANSVTVELRTPPPKGTNYMVRVSGDSMQPTIEDGDKIFIKNDKCINVGEIGIFIVNSDFYVKELGEGCLLSHNPSYPPIPLYEDDSIECRGKFLGICEEDFKSKKNR